MARAVFAQATESALANFFSQVAQICIIESPGFILFAQARSIFYCTFGELILSMQSICFSKTMKDPFVGIIIWIFWEMR